MTEQQKIPNTAKLLGFAGVLPFLVTAINLHTGWPLFNGFALQVFVTYSAIILSFLGGIRWGLALNQSPMPTGSLVLSVLPSLVALACLLLAQPFWQIAALGLAFAAQGVLDWHFTPVGMPIWMRKLRMQLSFWVVSCHVITLFAVQRWT